MKNILKEKPWLNLKGRILESTRFVADSDIKGKRILDIGCGFGWCELNFLNRGVKQIVGLEISEEAIAVAKNSIKNPRAEFVVGTAMNLPFPKNYFDTVVSWEVIEHLPKNTENNMFSEVKRVLKKNGVFYLSTPYDSIAAKLLDPAWWLIGHRHYSKTQLENFGKENGFEVKKIKIKGGGWSIASMLNLYFSKWILRREPIFEHIFKKKENQEYKQKDGFVNIFVKYSLVKQKNL